MSEKVRAWLEAIPKQERHQPVIDMDGKRYTAEQVVAEVESGSETGKKLSTFLFVKGLGTEDSLLIERLKNRLSRYPQDKPLFKTLTGSLTPSQILKEVEMGTKLGKEFLRSESNYLHYIGTIAGRV